MYRAQPRLLLLLALFALALATLIWQARRLATGLHAQREMAVLVKQARQVLAHDLHAQRLCPSLTACQPLARVQARREQCTVDRCQVRLELQLPPAAAARPVRAHMQQLVHCRYGEIMAAYRGTSSPVPSPASCFSHLDINWHWR